LGHAGNQGGFLGCGSRHVAARQADVDQGHRRFLSRCTKTKGSSRCLAVNSAGMPIKKKLPALDGHALAAIDLEAFPIIIAA
ncbi:hypothetical protein OFN94_40075, partial [Escherichia coli]|nr:hypothetical protein [Escherichia coli]